MTSITRMIAAALLFTVAIAQATPLTKTKQQKIEKLLELVKFDRVAESGIAECIEGTLGAYYAPDKVVEKNGEYHGMTPKSAQWPEVLAAFHRYAEKSCSGFSVEQLKSIYVEWYDKRIREEDLDAIIKFMLSPSGKALAVAQEDFPRVIAQASNSVTMKAQEDAATELRKELAEISAKRNSCNKQPWWKFWVELLCSKKQGVASTG